MTASPARRTPADARQVMERSETEDGLLSAIVEAALFLGWCVHHDRRSDLAKQQGTPGFPDLVLVRDGRVIFAELKVAKGNLSEDQFRWGLNMPPNTHAVSYFTWRPADLDAALAALR